MDFAEFKSYAGDYDFRLDGQDIRDYLKTFPNHFKNYLEFSLSDDEDMLGFAEKHFSRLYLKSCEANRVISLDIKNRNENELGKNAKKMKKLLTSLNSDIRRYIKIDYTGDKKNDRDKDRYLKNVEKNIDKIDKILKALEPIKDTVEG